MFNFVILCDFVFIPEYITLIGVLCMNFNLKKRGFVVINPGKNTETL